MANGYIEVSKREPCPICGTKDYCCHKPAEDGYGEVRICKRFRDSRVICPGGDTPSKIDGTYYILVNESHQGYGIYRSADDIRAAEEAGCKIWKKGALSEGYVKGPGISKSELIPVGITEICDDSTLDKFYRELIRQYPLKKEHKEYLKKEGWPEQLINNPLLCSFPVEDWRRNWHKNINFLPKDSSCKRAAACRNIISALGEPEGVPGFYLHQDKKTGDKYWDIVTRSGIGFPLCNQKNEIVRIRVRMDFLDVSEKYQLDEKGNMFFIPDNDNRRRYVSWGGVMREEYDGTLVKETDEKFRCKGKYRGLSSFSQVNNYDEGTYTNKYERGTEGSNIVGLVENNSDNKYMCILTEGEKKAYLGNYYLKSPFVIIPGVQSYNKLFETRVGKNILEHLIASGTEYFAIAFDADKYHNKMVLDAEKGLAESLLREGLKPVILNWDTNKGKGLDDCIVNHGQFSAFEITKDNIDEYYNKIIENADF